MGRTQGSSNKKRGKRKFVNKIIQNLTDVTVNKKSIESLNNLKVLGKESKLISEKLKHQTEQLLLLWRNKFAIRSAPVNSFHPKFGLKSVIFYGGHPKAVRQFNIIDAVKRAFDLEDTYFPKSLSNTVMFHNSTRCELFIPYHMYRMFYDAVIIDDLKTMKRRDIYYERMHQCLHWQLSWNQVIHKKPILGRRGKLRKISTVLKPLSEYVYADFLDYNQFNDFSYIKENIPPFITNIIYNFRYDTGFLEIHVNGIRNIKRLMRILACIENEDDKRLFRKLSCGKIIQRRTFLRKRKF